jgi:hypothetical protein
MEIVLHYFLNARIGMFFLTVVLYHYLIAEHFDIWM